MNNANEEVVVVQLQIQSLMYGNKPSFVMTFRDVNKIKQNEKLAAENKFLGLITSSVSHETITPLKCISSIANRLKTKVNDKDL